ncbi:hypothetical protein [Paracoccus mutanolyticus]|nr:hypothetical protein [Paracoccus mutanolyticus]
MTQARQFVAFMVLIAVVVERNATADELHRIGIGLHRGHHRPPATE